MGATWNLRALGVVSAVLASAGAASAGITPIGVFAGQYQEGFENRNFSWTSGNVPVFSGLASVHEKSQGSLILTSSWSFNSVVSPKEGTRFLGSPSAWIEYNFSMPIASFGGFFTTNSSAADGHVDFFLNGQLLSTQSLTAPKNGSWVWNGWTSPTGFDSVRITSNYSSGGFIMQDSMQVNSIPAPGGALACGLAVIAGLRRSRRA